MPPKNQIPKCFSLYVLKCAKGKYYVGITSQTPEKRFAEHVHGVRAAKWTLCYKPLALLDTKQLNGMSEEQAKAYENKVTRVLMKRYGYNNVRGGDLTDLEPYTVRFGRIHRTQDWEIITVIVLLLVTILFLLQTLYL